VSEESEIEEANRLHREIEEAKKRIEHDCIRLKELDLPRGEHAKISPELTQFVKDFFGHEIAGLQAFLDWRLCIQQAQILCAVADFLTVLTKGNITRECRARPSYETL
jgi:hypothetical protein